MRQLLSGLSIKLQVVVPVFFTLLLLIIGITFSTSSLKTAFHQVTVSTEQLITDKDNLTTLIDNTYAMRISAIYSLFRPAEVTALPNVLKEKQTENLALLRSLADNPELKNEVAGLTQAMQRYVDYSIQTMIPLLNIEHSDQEKDERFTAQYEQATAEYRKVGNEMIKAIDVLSNRLNQVAMTTIDESEHEHDSVMSQSTFALIGILLVAALSSWLLAGIIVTPIRQLQQTVREIAKGNLLVKAQEEGNNEITLLARDVNATVTQLRQTVESLVRISTDVASASTELATVMTQASVNSDQEKQEVEQVASAVNQLQSTAQSVTDHAHSADGAAQQANQLASQSLRMFEESHRATAKMADQLREAAQVVNQLKEQSERIGNVTEVIRSISEQTNLLALNAAIEAARAGESGRGFAVVADEVRMLAARTQTSTQEIQAIIEELQNQSNTANSSMHSSLSLLEQNQSLAAKVSASLTEINHSISALGQINAQVATASEEQSQVTKDINRNLSNIYELVSQNVTGITQSAAASHELSDLAEQQHQQLQYFRV
ncbi:TPA: methyl-accepting chemotaxis protein [Vibrio cholerae]|uniref:Methyl-accepting chemotaxis protein n=20 Tax=Vibrio cholerae TaxID=666 RepID=Q9KN97_VIBCH|nr:methyl-accepting chemotaxis protein [Vibrio cholerae]EEY46789.1 methyl-accepting chemotaxis protein [Vibrio cholerae INDRE 91/1]EYC48329.1 chemotaxis protein [Vibrio cholerae O1 biovar El Tor str. L-3226]MDG6206555.1 methyl-accepting chemotaxis protein [Vibrio sp. NO3-D2]AAF95982.1 methyl-accepting chemotaxis protein [Vibrio cholerae O1 biovar El Tor str. N16961]ABQ18690.1 methyl-accepting chemotaxis protein [Vibrio cholerae O395]